MMYIIDTANLEDIKRCVEFYPVAGVTTNPTIISKEHTDFLKLIKNIREIIGPDMMLHVQVTASKCDDIVKEALLLKEAVGGNFYVKIPISPEGLKATRILHDMGIKVTETAIFTQQQALIAALAGADFPAIPDLVSDRSFIVNQAVLKKMIGQVSFAMASNDQRAVLNGCFFKIDDDSIMTVACDGFKSAKCKSAAELENKNTNGNYNDRQCG